MVSIHGQDSVQNATLQEVEVDGTTTTETREISVVDVLLSDSTIETDRNEVGADALVEGTTEVSLEALSDHRIVVKLNVVTRSEIAHDGLKQTALANRI